MCLDKDELECVTTLVTVSEAILAVDEWQLVDLVKNHQLIEALQHANTRLKDYSDTVKAAVERLEEIACDPQHRNVN